MQMETYVTAVGMQIIHPDLRSCTGYLDRIPMRGLTRVDPGGKKDSPEQPHPADTVPESGKDP